jgi:lipoyl(octanoyl) transferase
MRDFTLQRGPDSDDQLWLVEHPPTYTLGQAGLRSHILDPGDIPVVHSDRGGQVTYHGPGQTILYTLIDLPRRGLGVRALVSTLEQAVVEVLAGYDISAELRPGAPGVYVANAKIASLGLRVRRGRSYHGGAINVAMDLEPFQRINPCGFPGLEVTQVADLGGPTDNWEVGRQLAQTLNRLLDRHVAE